MANIKSAIKRNRQNAKAREHNKLYRSSASGYVRKANVALEAKDAEKAATATKLAISALDRAASKGVIHKNNAARRKGALMRKLAAIQSGKVEPKAEVSKAKPKAKSGKAKPKAKAKKA